MMIISGIADEAGADIETQIKAHRELDWRGIELRLVNGRNCAGALGDEEFDEVARKVTDAGLQVTCFASAIANWSRKITDDFAQDVDELKTAIPRMHRLGTKFIRTMSWVGEGVSEGEWHDEAIRRYRELAKLAEDGDVYLAHENCTGWGGLSAQHMRRLIDEVGSDHLVGLYDTGNTVSHGQEPWTFYEGVKDLIKYVHIKDCRKNPAGGKSSDYTFPGEGDAMVREVLSDLQRSGYEGVVSIEPHVASIVHEGGGQSSPEVMYQSYLRYGRMLTTLLEAAQRGAGSGPG